VNQAVVQRYFHYEMCMDYLLHACCGINLNRALIYKSSFQDEAHKTPGMQIDATEDAYCGADLASLSFIKVSSCFHSLYLPIFALQPRKCKLSAPK
jgi:hypothetical protein